MDRVAFYGGPWDGKVELLKDDYEIDGVIATARAGRSSSKRDPMSVRSRGSKCGEQERQLLEVAWTPGIDSPIRSRPMAIIRQPHDSMESDESASPVTSMPLKGQ
jgi:hypothetical protein